jgi:hypothetical protein
MALSNEISEKGPFEADTDSSEKGPSVGVIEPVPLEHGHLNVGDILRGTAVHESTPFERKAALINA